LTDFETSLFVLRLVQLLIAIPALAIAGQGIVNVLIRMFGQDPKSNFFYRTLELIGSPLTWLCRWITPRSVADRHLPLVALLLLLVGYGWVTLEIGGVCTRQGLTARQCLQGP